MLSILFSCVSCGAGGTNTPEGQTTGSEATSTSTTGAPATSEPTTSAPVDNNGPKHYEIELNLDNFATYLNYSSEDFIAPNRVIHSNYTHTISGALTFAYYENVVVTFQIVYDNNGRRNTGVYNVKLNAAGHAEFHADDPAVLSAVFYQYYNEKITKSFTITNVTGKVIFSM